MSCLETHFNSDSYLVFQFAYGQRTELGDPAFVKNVSKIELEFITPKVGAEIRKELPLNHTGTPSVS